MFWRRAAKAYAALTVIPLTTGTCALVSAARGDRERARGFSLYTVTGALSLPVFLGVLAALPFELAADWDRRDLYQRMMRFWALNTARPFFEPRIVGAEHLPDADEAVVVVSNHASWMDFYTLCFLPEQLSLRFVAKWQVMLIPVAGWALAMVGHVPLIRGARDSHRSALDSCRERLRKGASVTFFAEGTRSRDGALGDFKMGAFKVAKDEGKRIVPITLVGTNRLMPAGEGWLLRDATPTIVVHPPVSPGDFEDVAALRDHVKGVVQEGLDRGVEHGKHLVGTPAPPLEGLEFVQGEPVDVTPGRVLVVEQWATWCRPCRRAIPHLNELYRKHRHRGLDVVGVSVDDSAEQLQAFIDEDPASMTYPVATMSDSVRRSYPRWWVPHAYVVDRTGKVVFVGHPDELEGVVEAALAG